MDATLIMGLALLAIMVVGTVLALRSQPAQHQRSLTVYCPHQGVPARMLLEQDVRTGQYGEVLECSRFDPAGAVTCDRACAGEMNRGAALDVPRPA